MFGGQANWETGYASKHQEPNTLINAVIHQIESFLTATQENAGLEPSKSSNFRNNSVADIKLKQLDQILPIKPI